MPDPVSQELCKHLNRIEHIEKRLTALEKVESDSSQTKTKDL
jgi:hypothetical protein